MKKGILALIIMLAAAVISHFSVVTLTPDWIMSRVFAGYEQTTGVLNQPVHAPRPDATSRKVVRPSPDLVYTMCAYDLTKGPLVLTGPSEDFYVSVSAFSDRTDNFFVMNDTELVPKVDGSRKFFVILIAPEAKQPEVADAHMVQSPTTRGVVLFRTLIESEDKLAAALEIQSQQNCATWSG